MDQSIGAGSIGPADMKSPAERGGIYGAERSRPVGQMMREPDPQHAGAAGASKEPVGEARRCRASGHVGLIHDAPAGAAGCPPISCRIAMSRCPLPMALSREAIWICGVTVVSRLCHANRGVITRMSRSGFRVRAIME